MQIRFFKVRIPFIRPFTTSFGTEEYREAIILHMNKDGIDAFSEIVTSFLPDYGYEYNDTAINTIEKFLAKYVADAPQPHEFLDRVKGIKGHNMAKGAVEMLLWDYHSKLAGKPLDDYMGKSRGYANVGISIGMSDISEMKEQVRSAVSLGYKRIKVKIKRGRENIVSEIRDEFPDIRLSVDANGDYSYHDIPLLKELDKFELEYIEQPFRGDDLIYHSKLKKEISTPVCLDESITIQRRRKKHSKLGQLM